MGRKKEKQSPPPEPKLKARRIEEGSMEAMEKDKKEHKIYEFIIGRFQVLPPHAGHLELIRTVLKEGKNVCIALREADRSEKNPYSYEERHRAFQKIFYKEIGERKVKIIKIPDIENVIYGRKPGWGIREIRLDTKTESISATEIRKKKK